MLLPKSAFARSRWKNGLGYTDQIAIEPPGADLRAGNYHWRISSASIESAAEFSVFPEHDRALMILSGAGLRLTHTDEGFEDSVDLPPFEAYEFPGDIRSRCELLDGPVKDLSVFFRKGGSASLEAVHLSETHMKWEWSIAAEWQFLFVVRGSFRVQTPEGSAESIAAGDAFRVDGKDVPSESTFTLEALVPDSLLVVIKIWR